MVGYDEDWNPIYSEQPTTYTFYWTLDASSGAIDISNGAWANLVEDSQFAGIADFNITANLLGTDVTVGCHFVSEYSDYTEEYKFTPALSNEALKANICQVFYFSVSTSDYSGVDVYVEFFADGTGNFFTADIKWNYSTGEYSFSNIGNIITFNWDLNADRDIVLSNLEGTMSIEYSEYNWETEQQIEGVSHVTMGTVIDVEDLAFGYIKFTYSNEYASNQTERGYTLD